MSPGLCHAPDVNAQSAETIRHSLGIAPSNRVLLFLNRFSSIKRPLETLAAFGETNPSGVTLVMAGFDAEVTAERLRHKARQYPAADIRIIGPVNSAEKWPLLAAADGYISFSVKENFGYSYAEAMWAGLPCIVTSGHDLLGARQSDERPTAGGWVIPVDDDVAIKNAIREFADASDATLRRMGNANGLWARCNLSEQAFSLRARSLLADLVEPSRLANAVI